MRYHLPFAAALVAVVSALAACGGSSSETPPPLQPDPAGFRYAPAFSRPVVEESDAGDAPRTNAVGTTDPSATPRAPAPSGAAPAPR
ncbi:MAG TPA: hypothetical protein VHM25_02035 [Polyangiaceae bacterium]|nr:hypothetical protein [Polyangiaceae bacterium]